MSASDVKSVSGGCLCGKVKYEYKGEPLEIVNCHCSLYDPVERLTFHESLSNLLFRFATKKDKFQIIKGKDALKVFQSSEHGRRTFCSHCGTQITFESSHREDLMDVTVASADHPEKLVPSFDIHFSSHLSWVPTDPKLPKYEQENEKGVWFTE